MANDIREGVNKHFEQSIVLDSMDDAEDMFVIAKERLLDVNEWHDIGGEMSASFTLTDKQGKELHRHAHKGDLVRIKIPGPGNAPGGGYDWVSVERIMYEDYPDDAAEQLILELKPAASPLSAENAPAHFFDEAASSIFVLERINNKLKASYYGLNEKPNTEPDNWADKGRNLLVAATAIAGGSALQWNALLKGIIDPE